MQNLWQNRVKEAVRHKIDANVLAAFNTNVDVVVHLTNSNLSFLQSHPRIDLEQVRKTAGEELLELSSLNELLAVLSEALKVGKSHYVILTDLSLIDWLEEIFSIRKESMGGQAGIIANQMADLGARSLAYTSLLSSKQASMFLPEVQIPVMGPSLSILNVGDAVRKQDPTKENWIFEYAKGEEFEIDGEVIVTPRANRVILATRPAGVTMGFDPPFKKFLPELGRELDVAFLAGFHYAPSEREELDAYLKESISDVRKLKEDNPRLRLHFEYVPMRDGEAERSMLEAVASEIRSFGINENEVKRVLMLFGYERESSAIEEDESAYWLYKGCLRLMDRLKFERIQLHNLGYYVVLLKKSYPVDPRRVREASLYASAVNAMKAKYGGTVSYRDLEEGGAIKLPEVGFKQLRRFASDMKKHGVEVPADFEKEGILDLDTHLVLIVPAQIVADPVSTVGMGDTISSSSFAYEWSPLA